MSANETPKVRTFLYKGGLVEFVTWSIAARRVAPEAGHFSAPAMTWRRHRAAIRGRLKREHLPFVKKSIPTKVATTSRASVGADPHRQ